MLQRLEDLSRDLPLGSPWLRPYTVLQTNLQEIDANMDVDAAVKSAIGYGADTWLLNAGGIVSFYPTDLPFQTRNPYLDTRPSGDLFGDAVAAAKRGGLKVIARLDMSKVSARIADEHPDWLYMSATGKRQVFNGLVSTCPSAAYYQSRSFDVLDEILDRYEVDAFFFNWFNFNERDYDEVMHGPCHCNSCRIAFDSFSGGQALPTDMASETFGLWRGFVAATLGSLTARISDHVTKRRPEVGLILRSGAPVVYLEANNSYRAMPGTDFWPYATAEAVSAHVSSRPGSSVMVNCVAFIDATYRMGSEQPEHFAHQLLQTVARGGNPSAYYMGAPGRLPMAWAISQGGEVMRFRQRHAELYGSIRPAAEIAIVRPDRSSVAPGTFHEALEEFRGIYSALLESHLTFDVLPVNELPQVAGRGDLAQYSLLVLPSVGNIGTAGDHLDKYVESGGKILSTGFSGISSDEKPDIRSSPVLQASGAPLKGAELRSTYVTDQPQPDAADYRYQAPIIPVFGEYWYFEWKPDAQFEGYLLPRASFAPPELAYGHTVSDHPASVRRAVGKGEAVVIPWTVGRTFREFGKTDVRDYFIGIVTSLFSSKIRAELHEAVEIIAGSNDDGMILHLVNHSGSRRRSYRPYLPVDGGRIQLRGEEFEGSTAQALLSERRLATTFRDGVLTIELPRLELFEVVTVTARPQP